MKLTQDQKDLLNGKYGEGAAMAMKIQIAIGESFEAKRMVSITRAHVALSNQDADLWFAEKLLMLEQNVELLLQLTLDFAYHILKKKNLCQKKIIK